MGNYEELSKRTEARKSGRFLWKKSGRTLVHLYHCGGGGVKCFPPL